MFEPSAFEISLVIDTRIGGIYINISSKCWPTFTIRSRKQLESDGRLMDAMVDYDERLTKYEELIPDLKHARHNIERAKNEIS